MDLNPTVCERARLSRDPRFDGRFFIGVVTTGVYCRPVCPVQPPKAKNVRFFPSAAAAAETGFRPCLRCRPESSPGTPAWLGTTATVSRALRLINEGALDDGNVAQLAARLGIVPRHLQRLFHQHLGASPSAVAQTRRLHFAKKLIDETDLAMAEVAFAAGFGSVRRFNHVVRGTYGRTPGALRRAGAGNTKRRAEDGFLLRLSFRPPFDWESLVDFLALRATPGVEVVDRQGYRRTVSLDGHAGVIAVAPARGNELTLRIGLDDSRSMFKIVERVRRMFDLGADPSEIHRHLEHAPRLAPLIRAHPGLRLPGSWDGFELAVRAILGQQVTVRGATTLAGRLARTFGQPLDGPAHLTEPDLNLLFPAPEVLAEADLASIGLPRPRARAIRHLSEAVVRGEVSFDASVCADVLVERLTRLPGVGDWTAQYVAMRALGAPDAFPATDLGLLRAVSNGQGPMTAKALLREAEAWRPWRAYGALHLWRSSGSQRRQEPAQDSPPSPRVTKPK